MVVLTALLLAGAWEWSAFLRLPRRAWRLGYVLLIVALLWGAWQVSASAAGRDWVLGLAVGWWLVALGWIVFAPRRVSAWSAALAGVLALVPAWLALVRLRLVFPHGAQWVLFVWCWYGRPISAHSSAAGASGACGSRRRCRRARPGRACWEASRSVRWLPSPAAPGSTCRW